MKKLNVKMQNNKIIFEHKGSTYSVSVTNDGLLRLAVKDGDIVIKPIAVNCVVLENLK